MARPRRLAEAVAAVTRNVADLLLPGHCAACGEDRDSTEGLCNRCNLDLLKLVTLPYCPRCGSTLGANIPRYEDGCPQCPNPLPRFSRVVRIGPYAQPLRAAIRDLKYLRQDLLRQRTGRLLAQAVRVECVDEGFDVALPIPAHWLRRLARGRDHSHQLAEVVAKPLGILIGDELVRVRHTPPQTRLSRTRRIENVRGAFGLASKTSLAGARVLLIDDVTTTGATANEAAKVLLAGGALRVTLAVAAKAESPTAYAERVTA